MIYECNLLCHSVSENDIEKMNIDDKGKWLPFAVDLFTVYAVKMTTDTKKELAYLSTTLITEFGQQFVIDTPYKKFITLWKEFNKNKYPADDEDLDLTDGNTPDF